MFEMSWENFENLQRVLEYLSDEERSCEENPSEHHIWLGIKPLMEWVEAEREKRGLGPA